MDPALKSRPVADRVLYALKRHGPSTAAELGEQLGTTGEAARQQLLKLATEHLVEATAEPKGVGRPAQTWHLTATGNSRFPDAHASLTADLLRTIRTTLGQPTLDLLIASRESETRKIYEADLRGVEPVEDRIARLAGIRAREGYMAEWRRAEDGRGWLLIENHCPICAAASVCQGFCRAELDIFRDVLGTDVTVEREEHILMGARRCAYRIELVGDKQPARRSRKGARGSSG